MTNKRCYLFTDMELTMETEPLMAFGKNIVSELFWKLV